MSTKDAKLNKEYDEAYEFICHKEIDSADETIVSDELSVIYRKIDLRILSILCGIYFLQFLDKTLLNYAAVMGIKKNLVGNQFSDLATILYVSYIVFEPVSAYLFQVLPPAKFFAACIICWGIVVVMHIFCQTYASLMVIRMLLGCFEACVAPGCIMITGMWWNKKQQLRRMGLWSIQAGTSTIFGGLLSFAFQHVDSTKTSLASWQIFFLLMGLITILYGVYVMIELPNNPTSAKFLNDREKMLVLENIRENQTGTENKVFKKEQIKELCIDPHTWPMFFLTVISMVATGAIITFSVTIISSFGFTAKQSALVQMPVGLSTILSIVGATYLCAYFNGNYRTYIFISLLVPAIIGYIVLLTTYNRIGNLLAIYLINTGTCVITMIYSWNGANTAGHTKRLARNCLTMIAFAIGALIGPQLFKAEDYPHYIPAKITLLVLTIVCIPLSLFVRYLSIKINRQRDLDVEGNEKWLKEVGDNYQFKDLTDIENKMFRYSY
ncbi:thiamine pathway transporter Thi73p [[Candida] anglica]|uniref:Thiamine pathway transporter Thi73p n=1 Tax=[Candida] anglica TaxID=148631 RepID=A0ABP0EMB1_9ASCO